MADPGFGPSLNAPAREGDVGAGAPTGGAELGSAGGALVDGAAAVGAEGAVVGQVAVAVTSAVCDTVVVGGPSSGDNTAVPSCAPTLAEPTASESPRTADTNLVLNDEGPAVGVKPPALAIETSVTAIDHPK